MLCNLKPLASTNYPHVYSSRDWCMPLCRKNSAVEWRKQPMAGGSSHLRSSGAMEVAQLWPNLATYEPQVASRTGKNTKPKGSRFQMNVQKFNPSFTQSIEPLIKPGVALFRTIIRNHPFRMICTTMLRTSCFLEGCNQARSLSVKKIHAFVHPAFLCKSETSTL